MRTVAPGLFLVVLLAACDQGAKAAPPPPAAPMPQATAPLLITSPTYTPYAVASDADFVAKATVVLDQLFGVFAQGGKDCKVVAQGLRAMTAENRTKFDVLTKYGEQHKSAQDALQQAIQRPMDRYMAALTTTMTACANEKELIAAFAEMSALKNLQGSP